MLVKFCLKVELEQEAEAELDSDVEVEIAVEEAPHWYAFVSADRFVPLHRSNSTNADQFFFFFYLKAIHITFFNRTWKNM